MQNNNTYRIRSNFQIITRDNKKVLSPYFVLHDARDHSVEKNELDIYITNLAIVLKQHLATLSRLESPASDEEITRVELLEKLLHAAARLEAHSYKKGVVGKDSHSPAAS